MCPASVSSAAKAHPGRSARMPRSGRARPCSRLVPRCRTADGARTGRCRSPRNVCGPFRIAPEAPNLSVVVLCSFALSNSDIPAPQLSNVMSEPGFHVAWFMKTLLHQFANPFLGGRSFHRSEERVPFGRDLDVRRQTCHVDEPLGIPNGVLIEGSDAGCERLNKSVELAIGQRAIHVPVELGQVAGDIVRAQQNLTRAPTAHQAWQ